MTSDAATGEQAIAVQPADDAVDGRWAAIWNRVEQFLEAAGDRLNPILIKETRQALKSRQFVLSFITLLAACWIVTIGGLAFLGPRVRFSASGDDMFIAYYAILVCLLVVIVPYSAFRSLASEREDNTFELLSITTLRARQIIGGKLSSSAVQMVVYLSAVMPCLAFTFLLRGIDVLTMVFLVAVACLVSLGLSMIGLLLGTVARMQFSQIVLSATLIGGLMIAAWIIVFSAWEILEFGFGAPLMTSDFLLAMSFVLTMYGTTFGLLYFTASSMLTFASENRSTPIRLAMIVQFACLAGWMMFIWSSERFRNDVLFAFVTLSSVYWYILGTILTSESPVMSERVRRSLPHTTFGRAVLTWFNPGPASGLMFAVANITTVMLMAFVGLWIVDTFGFGGGGQPGLPLFYYLLLIGWGYAVAYLGLGTWIITQLRRWTDVTLLAGFLIHMLLLLIGSGIPTVVQLMSVNLRGLPYTYLQITNPFWSLLHVIESRIFPAEANLLAVVVPAVAVCALILNLRAVIRECTRVRVAPPSRVVADESQLQRPVEEKPGSPWDQPE